MSTLTDCHFLYLKGRRHFDLFSLGASGDPIKQSTSIIIFAIFSLHWLHLFTSLPLPPLLLTLVCFPSSIFLPFPWYIFFLFFFSFLFINFVIFSSCVARQFSIEFSRRVVVVVVALMSLILVNTLRANNGPGSWILGCSFRLVASTPCRLSDLALICGGKIVIIFWRALPPGHSPPSPYSSSLTLSLNQQQFPPYSCFSLYFYFLRFAFLLLYNCFFFFFSSFFHFVFSISTPTRRRQLWLPACCPLILNKNLCCLHLHDTPFCHQQHQHHLHPLLHSKGISIYQSLKFHGWLSRSAKERRAISAISAKLSPKVKIKDIDNGLLIMISVSCLPPILLRILLVPATFSSSLFAIGFECEPGIQFGASVCRVWTSSAKSTECVWVSLSVGNEQIANEVQMELQIGQDVSK